MRTFIPIFAGICLASAAPAQMQQPDLTAQRAAVAKLAMLDGEWAGTATLYGAGGPRKLSHTERVGPMLDGSVRVIEGKSYEADGREAGFNALAVISYDERAKGLEFRSYAQGHTVTVPIVATGQGFEWTLPLGPNSLHYLAVVKDGAWHEEGNFVRAGAAPVPTIVLDLKRRGATAWPAEGAVKPR